MKRVIGLLAGLLAVMIGVTGCMNARVSFEQQAISYLEEKYGTSFTWIEPVGGQFGSGEKSGHVSTPDFAGKTLIPFATSGGSGISGAEKSLKEHCPAAAWKRGKIVNSGAAAWAKNAVKE